MARQLAIFTAHTTRFKTLAAGGVMIICYGVLGYAWIWLIGVRSCVIASLWWH